MKRPIYAILGLLIIGGGIGFYTTRPGNSPVSPIQPATEATSSPTLENTQPVKRTAVRPVHPQRASADVSENSKPSSVTPSVPTGAQPEDSAGFNQAIETLVSPQASFPQKQAAWKQLRETGKLDKAISEFEQRVANDPRNAEHSAGLGQAYLQKAGSIQDIPEQGILAMKADKSFAEALNLDPSNWEARFTKAVAMSYWPEQLNKGQEVIDNFTQLITQQEGQQSQPQFAQTYLWLGDQYQKIGRNDDAQAAWQRGAALFPDDSTLAQRLAKTGAK